MYLPYTHYFKKNLLKMYLGKTKDSTQKRRMWNPWNDELNKTVRFQDKSCVAGSVQECSGKFAKIPLKDD